MTSAAPAELLAEAASRWGTPLYLTDLDAAAARLADWQAAFPDSLIAYAVKANRTRSCSAAWWPMAPAARWSPRSSWRWRIARAARLSGSS